MSDSRAVFKYEIPVDDQWHEIPMPVPAKILHVACPEGVRGTVNLWAEVTPGSGLTEAREFRIFGTGQPITDDAAYAGTALAGPFVWHAYIAPEGTTIAETKA